MFRIAFLIGVLIDLKKKKQKEYVRKVQRDKHFSSNQRIGNGSVCSCKRGFFPTLFCYVGLLILPYKIIM